MEFVDSDRYAFNILQNQHKKNQFIFAVGKTDSNALYQYEWNMQQTLHENLECVYQHDKNIVGMILLSKYFIPNQPTRSEAERQPEVNCTDNLVLDFATFPPFHNLRYLKIVGFRPWDQLQNLHLLTSLSYLSLASKDTISGSFVKQPPNVVPVRFPPSIQSMSLRSYDFKPGSICLPEGIEDLHVSLVYDESTFKRKNQNGYADLMYFSPFKNIPSTMKLLTYSLQNFAHIQFQFHDENSESRGHSWTLQNHRDEIRCYYRFMTLFYALRLKGKLRAWAFRAIERVAQRKYAPSKLHEFISAFERENGPDKSILDEDDDSVWK